MRSCVRIAVAREIRVFATPFRKSERCKPANFRSAQRSASLEFAGESTSVSAVAASLSHLPPRIQANKKPTWLNTLQVIDHVGFEVAASLIDEVVPDVGGAIGG